MAGITYALLAGIDNYPKPSYRLSGCRNDVLTFAEMLTGRVPEAKLRMETLLDEQASREGVIDGFRRHLGQAGKGDSAVFFYAGHGSQERAPEEFWQFEPDRLDETLVLWDSRKEGNWDFADKELASLIRLVADRGAHVAVILDCCHSGSGTRAADRAEKVRRVPADGRIRPLDTFLPEVRAALAARSTSSAADAFEQGRHVLLAACRDDEEASEYTAEDKKCGAFSHFLLKALATGDSITYRDAAASARVGLTANIPGQAPQLEATLDSDLDMPFLGGAIQSRPKSFLASMKDGEAWMDGGRIHGVRMPSAAETTKVALFAQNATADEMRQAKQAIATAEITEVQAGRSRLHLTRGTLQPGVAYKAVPTSVPLPPHIVHLQDTAPECEQIRSALGGSTLVRAGKEGKADFVLECSPGAFSVRAAVDGRLLTAPAASVADAVRQLEHIARWMSFAELENPASGIDESEIEVKVFSGAAGHTELSGRDLRLVAQRAGTALVAPQFRIRIANRGSRDLFVALLAMDELFCCSTDLLPNGVERLQPGQEVWALGGKGLKSEIPNGLRREGRTTCRDIVKVIACTSDFDIRDATLKGLKAPPSPGPMRGLRGSTLDRLLARANYRTISAADDEDTIDDFRTHTVLITTVEPQESVSLSTTDQVDAGAGVTIEPHPALRAQARLTTMEQTRGDTAGHILPPLLRGAVEGTETIQMVSRRGASPGLSVLELSDIFDHEAVTPEQPLTIHLPVQVGDDETVAAIAWDGEDYLVLGRGRGTVQLSRLPHPVGAGKRSLTGSVKILFQKFVSPFIGRKYEHPLLAAAEWNEAGKVQYEKDPARVKAQVGAARRVLVFVHGIIGDTLGMGAKLKRRPGEVFLTFDYENLHTTIEANAEGLRERLEDAGLRPGHGKEVVLIAHSMGGLVSRWYIEKLGGHEVVSRLILCGTPNAGSPWATAEDWAIGTATLVLNQLTQVSWEAAVIGRVLAGVELIDNSLDQMRPGSALLNELAACECPKVPYAVVAGNTSISDAAGGGRVARVLKKALHRTASFAFLFEPNDVAVSIESIRSVGSSWNPQPAAVEVACDHMSYFSSEAGLRELRRLLEEQTTLAGTAGSPAGI